MRALSVCVAALLVACASEPDTSSGGDMASAPANDMATGGDLASSGVCPWTLDTTPTGAVNGGCAMLTRDTSSCQSARMAAGLSGFWLEFSCDVTLSVQNGNVVVSTKDMPDYQTNYFPTGDPCHTATPAGRVQNPNSIALQSLVLNIPLSPTGASQPMMGGAIGVAVNGVEIFDNQAAPGDDIFMEAISFDACEGHPQMTGAYHYHAEPYAISYDDDHFIGVLRDGYAVYGRRDADGSLPTLDASGGHVGVPPDGTSAVYHYHANQQTDAKTGQMQWFLSTGTYHGAPGVCSGCL